MPRHDCRFPLPIALLLLALAGGARADDVTIYRCTDAQGRLSLRDTPCAKGQHQQAVEMLRPRDPPPQAAAPPAIAATAPATPAVVPTVVVLAPPQPVYECTTPDGERYTSANPGGNPRWVPLWTLGYPAYGGYDHHRAPRRGRPESPPVRATTSAAGGTNGLVFDNVGRPAPTPPGDRPGVPGRLPAGAIIQGPGSWISDSCRQLPQGEVCGRLRDRRWELDRRYNSALQSERRQIDAEQRDIDARLATDCVTR